MTKTASHRRNNKLQLKGSRFGARNIWCSRYNQCLDNCLADNQPGFSCQGCQYEQDTGAAPKDQAELTEDVIVCQALIFTALGKIKRETAFKIQGVTVRRGGMG